MTTLLGGIVFGFLSSFHCIGMCGPIALSLPIGRETPWKRAALTALYNFGRMITYSFFGAVAGLVGQSMVWAGYQQFLSVFIGVVILLVMLIPAGSKWRRLPGAPVFRFFDQLKKGLASLMQVRNRSSLLLIGLLNGLLPCGLVYLGIAAAASTGDALQGALLMFFFGIGTLPAMMTVPLSGNIFTSSVRSKMRKSVPVFISFTAVLLILRGMNLGIPYISPKIDTAGPSCHSPTTTETRISCSGHASAPSK